MQSKYLISSILLSIIFICIYQRTYTPTPQSESFIKSSNGSKSQRAVVRRLPRMYRRLINQSRTCVTSDGDILTDKFLTTNKIILQVLSNADSMAFNFIISDLEDRIKSVAEAFERDETNFGSLQSMITHESMNFDLRKTKYLRLDLKVYISIFSNASSEI